MDTNERQKENLLAIDKNAQINLVVRSESTEDEIDLVNVFRTFKQKSRLYAWVMIFCIVAGLCAPLLLYQFSRPMLTVSSVVTLNYGVDSLIAPDGNALDLSQLTSSYVLQNALNGLELSYPVSVSNLRSNIQIERLLTEESRQAQELAAKMTEDKNANAYTQAQSVELTYDHKFIVSLTNGFGDEDSKIKYELKADELRLVLGRVLDAYNDYLITTYGNLQLPDDEISPIDTDHYDILKSLELLRTAEDNLYDYCKSQKETIRSYRSWQTGRTLNDWMETLRTGRAVNIDYLYSYVYINSIVVDKDSMLTSYQYQLRNTQTKLDAINKNIETVKSILESYKNDDIFVSVQEADSTKSTTTTTDYFNKLILEQAENYKQAAKLEIDIADLNEKINNLTDEDRAGVSSLLSMEQIKEDLNKTVESCQSVYNAIKAHMEEVQASPLCTDFTKYTVPQGNQKNFLASNAKNMIVGAVIGAVIACGLWFVAALAPEFTKMDNKKVKEEAAK